MTLNLKEVLGTQEFHEFTSLLKDISPYQLKIDQANGCFDVLKKEEKRVFQQLQKKLIPYYEKLDKAWFT